MKWEEEVIFKSHESWVLLCRLVPRLKSLKFQLHYPELVQDCKPDIVAATEACQEVRACHASLKCFAPTTQNQHKDKYCAVLLKYSFHISDPGKIFLPQVESNIIVQNYTNYCLWRYDGRGSLERFWSWSCWWVTSWTQDLRMSNPLVSTSLTYQSCPTQRTETTKVPWCIFLWKLLKRAIRNYLIST